MLTDFTITIYAFRKPLATQVKIHNTIGALRGAATKFDRECTDDHSDTLGICHRTHMAGDPVCAIVRLAPPYIGAGIVAHEMTHAAVWMWQIHNKFEDAPLHSGNDELFCWVLGELVSKTTNKLIEKGVY